MLDTILSQAVNGLVLGFLYVLIAVGLSIIFGMLGIVNFAHGSFLRARRLFRLTSEPELRLGRGIAGAASYRRRSASSSRWLLIRRLYDKEPLLGLILTFALALLIEAILRLCLRRRAGAVQRRRSSSAASPNTGPILITKYRMFVLLVTVLVLVAFWAFSPTRRSAASSAPARAIRRWSACSASTCRSCSAACSASAACWPGIAGMLAAPLWTVTPSMASGAIMPAFVIITIGGLGSYAGAIIAGLLVGIITAMTIQFEPEWSGAAMYVLMAVVLLVRPRGLLGEKWERFE